VVVETIRQLIKTVRMQEALKWLVETVRVFERPRDAFTVCKSVKEDINMLQYSGHNTACRL
jgi:hypothetical protein